MPGFSFLGVYGESICGMINPHVVDDHLSGEDRIVDAFLAAPAPTDRDVQQQMKALIEGPFGKAVTGILEGEVNASIQEEADLSCIPFYSIDMKSSIEVLQEEALCFLGMDDVVEAFCVDAAKDAIGHEAYVLHDIDLAACRPAAIFPVGGQQPDRGPKPPACGQLRAHFDAAIEPVAFALCAEPGGSV